MSKEVRVAIVTGASSGIGRGIARGLAGDGHRVAVWDVDADGAGETVRAIRDDGGTAEAFSVDIADEAAVDAAMDGVHATFGPAGVLVNNAGWDRAQPFVDNERDFIRKVIAINLVGPITIAQLAVRDMIAEGKGGRIINIASDAGRVGSAGETVYAGAKGGVIAFTKSLAREMARHEITVNCICPGPNDTPLFHAQPEKMKDALIRAIPFRRLGQPADIANAVRYFVSDGAGYVTGQVLSVSGGLTLAG